MKPIVLTPLGVSDHKSDSDREALIASKIEEYGAFGDVILRTYP